MHAAYADVPDAPDHWDEGYDMQRDYWLDDMGE
jgi:hypothetical protein